MERTLADWSDLNLPVERAEAIANLAVKLAALGPRLALLAGETRMEADGQAVHARDLARMAAHLERELQESARDLSSAAVAVRDSSFEIERLADQTRVLSINANIEAARAGVHGKSFMVVAGQVERLANQTREATGKIEARVGEIQRRVARVTELIAQKHHEPEGATVAGVHVRAGAMQDGAERQKSGSHHLSDLSEEAKAVAESLLFLVGTFRLELHRTSAREILSFLPVLAATPWDLESLHRAFGTFMAQHPGFELMYLTDGQGVQISGNVYHRNNRLEVDGNMVGHPWVTRPWYTGARSKPGDCFISDIYRSEATGEFCFTIAAAVQDESGEIRGVLGADLHFLTMMRS